VSRVGSAAQLKSMKQVAGSIKLELAQYREMASFSQFASDLDTASQKLLSRGERLTELLKQNQFSPLVNSEQVVSLFAGTRGHLDGIEIKQIQRFEKELLANLKSKKPELLETIQTEGKLTDKTEQELETFCTKFARVFA